MQVHDPGHLQLSEDVWVRVCARLQLSPREIQVVRGVFDDQKELCIAHRLGISPHTVNTYLQRLYAKLDVSSRPQLILRIMGEYLSATGATRGAKQ